MARKRYKPEEFVAKLRQVDVLVSGNPVGVVCIAVARDGSEPLHVERKYGDIGREKVQERAMTDALAELIRCQEMD